LIAISRSNWLFLWAGIELNLLSFIPLIIVYSLNQETEASIKYFLAQALGSRVILISRIALWFIDALPTNLLNFILLIALILKLGIAPCHLWYTSVITSMSWVSCLILSTWQKLAPLAIISFIITKTATNLILLLGAINAIIGGIIGINQSHLRTIIAYSSITHIGWIISLASLHKLIATIIYFIIYSLLISPIFLLFQKFSVRTRISINKLIIKVPIIQFISPVLLLSLGGLPPLTGFLPKWITIILISDSNPYIILLLICGAIINLYFYLNITFNILLSPNILTIPINKPKIKSINILISISTIILFLSPVIFLIYAMTILN